MTRRARLRAVTGLIGGFSASVILSGAVSIAAVPVVIVSVGPDLWAGIAVAQAVAAFAQVVVTFGWAVTGPATVAGLDLRRRGDYFRGSLTSRVWLAVVAIPLAIALISLCAPGDDLANAFAAVATIAPSLGAAWFFVGERAPRRLLLADTLPRATGTAVGAVLLVVPHLPLVAFTAGQAAGAIAAAAIGCSSVLRRHPGRVRLDLGSDLRRLRHQTSGMTTAVVAAVYVNLPVALAGVLVPQQVALYAIGDRLQKLVLTALGPVFQSAQGLLGSSPQEGLEHRARAAARLAVVTGAATATVFAALGGRAAALLSGGTVVPPPVVVVALGVALGAICLSAVVGTCCLTVLGAVRRTAVSTALGAVIGVPLMIAAGSVAGIGGIAIGAALSELIVVGYQLIALRRLTRDLVARPHPTHLLEAPAA